MTRKTLTGLLLAASAMTAGTLTVAHAQEGDNAAQQQADLEAAIAAALAEQQKKQAKAGQANKHDDDHGHDHSPTTVHSGETTFEIDDETAYPDPDGFASMFDRISYAIGRSDGKQIPTSQPDLNTKTYAEGIKKGLGEPNKDYALGYAQGFDLARRFLAQQPNKPEMDAFIAGIAAALKEDDQGKAIGYLIGNSYREAKIDLKADSYLNGIDEAMAKPEPAADGEAPKPAKTKLTEEQVRETLTAFNAYMEKKQKDDAVKTGEDYIVSLKAEDGWKKTQSGIAYRIIEAGEGDNPDANDIATMDYELRLLDGDKPGSILQTTFDTDQTVDFSADRVIEGWGEILQIMNAGATLETVIPYNLGYKEQGSPPNIPPYATLIFKMKMHSFKAVEDEPKEQADEKPADKPAQ